MTDSKADNKETGPPKRLPRSTIILAGVFLALPAMVPFYFAIDSDDIQMSLLFGAFGVVVLIANGLMLALLVRWMTRFILPDSSDDS